MYNTMMATSTIQEDLGFRHSSCWYHADQHDGWSTMGGCAIPQAWMIHHTFSAHLFSHTFSASPISTPNTAMWRGVRQQLLRLADLPPCSSLAAPLHELHTGQPTAMLSHASVWHVQTANKSDGAVRNKYHPAIHQSRMVEYKQRLKQWRKELLAEVGAAQAEEERLRREKIAQYRADAEARYEAKLDRQRLDRLRLARERAEYEQAKVRHCGMCVCHTCITLPSMRLTRTSLTTGGAWRTFMPVFTCKSTLHDLRQLLYINIVSAMCYTVAQEGVAV